MLDRSAGSLDDKHPDGFLRHLAAGLGYDDIPDVDVVGEGRLTILRECIELYADRGVIAADRSTRPLDEHCVECAYCWSGSPAGARPARGENDVSAPWIGPGYPIDGHEPAIVMVGINMVSYGGIGALWWIANARQRALGEGRHPRFYYPLSRYAAIIRAQLLGRDVPLPEEGAAHREALRGIALVEAVKCSPRGNRSRPPQRMLVRCPPTYLANELSFLRPDWIVGLGQAAVRAVAGVTDGTLDWSDRPLVRGSGHLDGRAVELVGLGHPSWPRHYGPSMRTLSDHPIAPR